MTAADGGGACRTAEAGLGGGAARAADIALVARCSCCRRKSEPAAAKGLLPKSSLMVGHEDGMSHGGRYHESQVAWNAGMTPSETRKQRNFCFQLSDLPPNRSKLGFEGDHVQLLSSFRLIL